MLDAEALAEMLAPIISEEVAKTTAPLLARIAELEKRQPEQGPPGEKGEPGIDGVSPDPQAIAATLTDTMKTMIGDAVAGLPPPERGTSGEKGEPGEPGVAGQNGADGRDGADGRGVKELLIDREGNLIASMDDGEMKSLGPVIGRDGEKGADGSDGLGFEDLDVSVLDDDRTIAFAFRRGDEEKTFTLKWPTVIDRGVYKAGEEYEAGDAVSWGGSLWIAQKATDAKPDTPDSGWRLAVKRGRDGKDAKNG